MGKERKETVKDRLSKIGTGALVGLANGLFGGGGGMIAVPLLKKLGMEERSAHATAIAVIFPVSVASFLVYAYGGFCDFSVLIPTAIGVFLGGIIGAKLLQTLPERTVKILFSILQAFAGAWLMFSV
ncbi:MAG: sulfite exporter TauE/SafE family protein [Clostridia bacterium]|nr:sulfite exporter TauE/SafE family protein [Clostridia bacterium]